MCECVYAGIDVSARTLSVARETTKGLAKRSFTNDSTGHRQLLQFLGSSHGLVRVCLEPTGIYSVAVALALHDAEGIEVSVPNPKAVHNFGEAWMTRQKTDSQDSIVLLEFARRMPFKRWCPPPENWAMLRELVRYERALKRDLAAARNRLHKAASSPWSPPVVRASLEHRIAGLKEDIAEIMATARGVIESDNVLRECSSLVQTIPGIGPNIASHLLAELLGLPDDMDVKQWVAMAGLDVRERTSGTSLKGKPRISKTGNRHVRRVLYLAAMAAVRWQSCFRWFHDRLLARGKKRRQSLVAVMRKMLHAVYGILRHRQPFDPLRLFPALA